MSLGDGWLNGGRFYSSRSKWPLLPMVPLSGVCVWSRSSSLLHTLFPSFPLPMPEGEVLDEMHLLSLS